MNRSTRFKQDAVIVMAIIVLLLALWRLHFRSNSSGGGVGAWIGTNIIGTATLTLLSGSETGSPDAPVGGPAPVTNYNNSAPARTNAATTTLGQPTTNETGPISNPPLSTNLLKTNGPVTTIAVLPSDLAETPSGVSAASNIPDAGIIARRLGEVGAKGGDIQISLFWRNYNDLDLHCIDPGGEEIWFSNRRSHITGGELDVDQNAEAPFNSTPVENINWPIGAAPRGRYRIFVVFYAQHDRQDRTPFTVRTVVRGVTNFYTSAISFSGLRERKLICNLQY